MRFQDNAPRKELTLCFYDLSCSVYRSKVALLLRGFFGVRPPRSTLRRRGILKERLFGCDLGEHLMNSGEKGLHAEDPVFVVMVLIVRWHV